MRFKLKIQNNKNMLLFSWLLDLSALRQGKAISLASCNVTRSGDIITEEYKASPSSFPPKRIEFKIASDLKYSVTVLEQDI